MTYDDLIQEALTLRDHLDEWRDQFTELTPEAYDVTNARGANVDMIQALVSAKGNNRVRRNLQIQYALQRVAQGTSTVHDANLLRDALNMGEAE